MLLKVCNMLIIVSTLYCKYGALCTQEEEGGQTGLIQCQNSQIWPENLGLAIRNFDFIL